MHYHTRVHSVTHHCIHTPRCIMHTPVCTLTQCCSSVLLLLHILRYTRYRHYTDAPGCIRSAHVPKECMLYIHAEGGPPVIVNGSSGNGSSANGSSGNSSAVDNNAMPIQVFKHLEINIFPGTSYTLMLQVCVHSYIPSYQVLYDTLHNRVSCVQG
jgi:hypothetical protein